MEKTMKNEKTYTTKSEALKTFKDVKYIFENAINSDKTERMGIFSMFYNFSVRNTFLAYSQAKKMGIKFTPFKTKNGWAKFMGISPSEVRMVEGSHKIVICQPVYENKYDEDGKKIGSELKYFSYPRSWIFANQVQGLKAMDIDDLQSKFDFKNLLNNLKIDLVDFDFAGVPSGCGGYSISGKNEIAFNPFNRDLGQASLVLFHEIAHSLLHNRDCKLPRDIKELEAECTALLCARFLDLDDSTCNYYLQHWKQNGSNNLKTENYKRILGAFQKIINASKVKSEN